MTYVYHCLGAIALAEILAENRQIKYLDIRDNDIRIAGLMALSLAHKINHRLLQQERHMYVIVERIDIAVVVTANLHCINCIIMFSYLFCLKLQPLWFYYHFMAHI